MKGGFSHGAQGAVGAQDAGEPHFTTVGLKLPSMGVTVTVGLINPISVPHPAFLTQ